MLVVVKVVNVTAKVWLVLVVVVVVVVMMGMVLVVEDARGRESEY